jgi:Sap, sulfolipid-1-addressing protein
MGGLIVEILPYAVAAMLAAPIVLVVSALIIGKAKRPIRSAALFVLGAVLFDVVFAGVLLTLYRAGGLDSGSGEASAWIDTILGILFLLLGFKATVTREAPEEQEAQRARVEKLATARPIGLMLGGIVVQIINADALIVFASGLKEIATTNPFPSVFFTILVVIAVFLFIMLIPYHLPIELYAVSPQRAGSTMRAMSAWLLDHSRTLEIVVGFGFGAIFLWKGLAVLIG